MMLRSGSELRFSSGLTSTRVRRALLFAALLRSAVTQADCYDSAIDQTAINRCAHDQAQQAEQRLQQLISELQPRLTAVQRLQLQAAQTAWKQVLRHDCALEAGYVAGGSIEPLIIAGCAEQHRLQRIQQLRHYLCPPVKEDCAAADAYRP